MTDFFHNDAIGQTLAELKTAALQAQETMAAAKELIANLNELVLRLKAMAEAVSQAGK